MRVGYTQCQSTSWSSESSVKCHATSTSVSSTTRTDLVLTTGTIVGTAVSLFSFDSPDWATKIDPPNAPTSGQSYLTLSGFSFAGNGYTPSISIGASSCLSSSWSTSTSVTCTVRAGAGTSIAIISTLGDTAGTRLSAFSYDSPAVSSFDANMPTTAAAILSLYGFNFGVTDGSMTAKIGSTMCRSDVWVSTTLLQCVTPAAAGSALSLVVLNSADAGSTRSAAITFDAPVVTFLDPINSPLCTSTSITLQGFNFAASDLTPSAKLGSSWCGACVMS